MYTVADKLDKLYETKKAIKQAIKDKNVNVPDGTPFAQYPAYIQNISGAGFPVENENFVKLVEGSAVDLVLPEGATTVSTYVLRNQTNLRTLTYPTTVETLPSGCAITNCSRLEQINAPSLTAVPQSGFSYKNSGATTFGFNAPNLTRINTYGFYNSSIREIDLPKIEVIDQQSFCNTTHLERINIPNYTLKIVGSSAFRNCGLTEFYLRCTDVNLNQLCSQSTKLTTLTIDNKIVQGDNVGLQSNTTTNVLKTQVIYGCPALETLTIKNLDLANQCIYNCPKLTTINLDYDLPLRQHYFGVGAFNAMTGNIVINCSFAEGEVAGAPWGAVNATINYNVQF